VRLRHSPGGVVGARSAAWSKLCTLRMPPHRQTAGSRVLTSSVCGRLAGMDETADWSRGGHLQREQHWPRGIWATSVGAHGGSQHSASKALRPTAGRA
jgi:hypothetical protein